LVQEGLEPDAELPAVAVPGIVAEPQPLWLVDCGNFMAHSRYFPELKGNTHMEVMDYLGAVAVVPGHEELAMPGEQAAAALEEWDSMLVSCNLSSKLEEVEVSPYSSPAAGWYFIGLSSWEPASGPPPAERWWELSDPLDAARETLDELPDGARAVVIAANQPDEVVEQLAAMPFAAILGYGGDREQWPAGSAPVYPAPEPKGGYVELVSVVDTVELSAQEKWRVHVSEDWPDDEQVNAMLVAELDRRLELIREEWARKWGDGGYQNIEWGTSERYLPQKSEAVKAAERGEAVYVGVGDCAKCHLDEYKKWIGSRHAHSFASLEENGDQENIDCLSCHSTALLEPGGYDPFQQRSGVKSVTCESCHGPGSVHALNKQGQGPFEGPGIQGGSMLGCVKCHDEVNSPEFDPAEYWPKIEH
jgi:hypothetical protein